MKCGRQDCCILQAALQSLPDALMEIRQALMAIAGQDVVDHAHADDIGFSGAKKEAPWGEQPVGIVQAEDIHRDLALARDFQGSLTECAEMVVAAAGAFRKNKKIATASEIRPHGFHLRQHQPYESTGG